MSSENKKMIGKSSLSSSQLSCLQKKNSTGLQHLLEESIESLSGVSLKDVKVHFNSDMPTELNDDPYTQGEDIHVAPRQEQHLSHKAEHCPE